MRHRIDREWWRDRRGTTSIEYALIASIVAITAIGGLQALGSSSGVLFDTLQAIVDVLAGAS